MENTVKAIALNKKGQFSNVVYARTCKTLKGAPVIVKTTKASNVRIGASYDALKSTWDAKGVSSREEAEACNKGLNGMKWLAYPVLLKGKNEKEYIRFETSVNTKFESVYTMNGKEVSKAEVEPYLAATEKKSGSMPTVFNVGVENIQYLK